MINLVLSASSRWDKQLFFLKIVLSDVYIESYRPKSVKIDRNNNIFDQYAREMQLVHDFIAYYFIREFRKENGI